MSVYLSPFDVAVVIRMYAVPPLVADDPGVVAAGSPLLAGTFPWLLPGACVGVPGEHADTARPAATTRLRPRSRPLDPNTMCAVLQRVPRKKSGADCARWYTHPVQGHVSP